VLLFSTTSLDSSTRHKPGLAKTTLTRRIDFRTLCFRASEGENEGVLLWDQTKHEEIGWLRFLERVADIIPRTDL